MHRVLDEYANNREKYANLHGIFPIPLHRENYSVLPDPVPPAAFARDATFCRDASFEREFLASCAGNGYWTAPSVATQVLSGNSLRRAQDTGHRKQDTGSRNEVREKVKYKVKH